MSIDNHKFESDMQTCADELCTSTIEVWSLYFQRQTVIDLDKKTFSDTIQKSWESLQKHVY